MLIGTLEIDETIESFYSKSNIILGDYNDLNRFSICLNSPWSQTDESYIIEYNCKDAYTSKNESEPDWKCQYKVIGYDMVISTIFAYGNTKQEALENCIFLFNRLQRKYNKDDKCF